jgi:hypothetical protein
VRGERRIFEARAAYNGTIMPRDQHGMPWSSIDGCCMDGPDKGRVLERVPAYQMTWGEWRAAHPDTDVITEPAPGTYNHVDLRHGHGADQYPGRNGIYDHFLRTIEPPGAVDETYPENILSLFVHLPGELVGFPLPEVRRCGGVVNTELAGEPIAIFAKGDDGFTMGAYSRRFGQQAFTFTRDGDHFVDDLTRSSWDVEGRCVGGTLMQGGNQLWPLDFVQAEWHNFPIYHPATRRWRCEE